MSSEPVTSEPQQRGERSSHTGSVADFIAMLSSWRRPLPVQPPFGRATTRFGRQTGPVQQKDRY